MCNNQNYVVLVIFFIKNEPCVISMLFISLIFFYKSSPMLTTTLAKSYHESIAYIVLHGFALLVLIIIWLYSVFHYNCFFVRYTVQYFSIFFEH